MSFPGYFSWWSLCRQRARQGSIYVVSGSSIPDFLHRARWNTSRKQHQVDQRFGYHAHRPNDHALWLKRRAFRPDCSPRTRISWKTSLPYPRGRHASKRLKRVHRWGAGRAISYTVSPQSIIRIACEK